ncbi:MAG: hybrid sensor histidine kinase/response regulator [Verrucomicrobiota bacterium]
MNPNAISSGKPIEILAVDDTPANLHLLMDFLEKQGFCVRPAISGRGALSAVTRRPPDLILLDAGMPEMDGFEVCAKLKEKESTREIPVIFISAYNATEDKLKAFQAGGADYITKPFQIEEVLARVNAHLKIRQLQLALKKSNESLESMVSQRTRQLAEANEKLSLLDQTKSDFLTLISHELRTPLHGLFGAADLAFEKLKKDPVMSELSGIYEVSRQRLMTMLDQALLLTTIQAKGGDFANNVSQLDEILKAVGEEAAGLMQLSNIHLSPLPVGCGNVLGDWFYLKKALVSLIETVVKYSKPKSRIEIRAHNLVNQVCLTIEGSGHNVPENQLKTFFDVLAIPNAPEGDLGLSPAVAHRIIALLGGQVLIANRETKGIQIQAWLPRFAILKNDAGLSRALPQ